MVRSGARSVVVTLDELLATFGSGTPPGGVMVAVLVIGAVPVAVPVMVIESVPPAGSAGNVPVTALPATFSTPQEAPPPATHEAPTPVTAPGTVSEKVVLFAASGPALVTLIEYVIGAPVAMLAGPSLVIAMSATGVTVRVADAGAVLVPALEASEE